MAKVTFLTAAVNMKTHTVTSIDSFHMRLVLKNSEKKRSSQFGTRIVKANLRPRQKRGRPNTITANWARFFRLCVQSITAVTMIPS